MSALSSRIKLCFMSRCKQNAYVCYSPFFLLLTYKSFLFFWRPKTICDGMFWVVYSSHVKGNVYTLRSVFIQWIFMSRHTVTVHATFKQLCSLVSFKSTCVFSVFFYFQDVSVSRQFLFSSLHNTLIDHICQAHM